MGHHLLWIAFGLLTAFLYYRKSEKINIFFATVITLFGMFSFLIWLLFNLKTEVKNPLYGIGFVTVYEKPEGKKEQEKVEEVKIAKKSPKK